MKTVWRIFKLTKPWAKYLVVSTVALFAISAINLYSPYIIKQVIAIFEGPDLQGSLSRVITLACVLLGCYALRAVLQFVNSYYAHVASWRLVSRIRCMVYDHLQKLSMSYYHDKQTGQLMSGVINDTSTLENLIAHAIPDLATNAITLVGVCVILAFINPLLTLLVCIPIPFIAVLSSVLHKIRRFFRQGQQNIAELSAVLQDNFSGMKEIQGFNKQESESAKVHEKSEKHATALIRALFFSAILHPSVGLITSVGTVIVLIAGPLIAVNTGLSISDVVAFLLYLNMFYAPVTMLTRVMEDLQHALAGAERAFEILDTEPDIKDNPGAKEYGRLQGAIEFNNVNFSYKEGIEVLKDISFSCKAGEMIALVGPTGVGKSTISGLVSRFYDTDSGTITIDGIDIKDMTLGSLRDQLSIVFQDVFLFNGTIADNIAYGCESCSKEQIIEAAKTACIDEYIQSLPEGYDTVIGERGVRLSGGQKQRISIARCILRGSPIMILDEATSAVDTETEKEIQKAIEKIAGTRTLLVIAHRLSTIRKADKIIVLENGEVTESGTHEQLMENGGTYASLCKIQSF